ncbi:MAG: 16S rRNA (guanine(527)-N(7))-methyltransferase RsmG [Bryobacteraceae bacterium]|jgi:16S rRNA (guanine527-N7)-methyltransferase
MFAKLLRSKLAGICELSEPQIARLHQHYDLLTRWNEVLSLSSVRTLEEAVERHYCESVFAAVHLPEGTASIGDIGSGAGFPGIPLAIVRPHFQVVLIESHRRKAVFLKEASRDLANVRVLARRAEDIAECFDWVVSRGVRYSDIRGSLKKLGRNAELLTGDVQPSDLSGFEWRKPIQLPWGDRRYLWIGSNDVSRETERANCFT